MTSKKKPGGGNPLDDLGSAFDDLVGDAEETLREAQEELTRLAGQGTRPTRRPEPEAQEETPGEQIAGDSRASRSRRPAQYAEPADESDFCRALKERIDNHGIHVARVSPDSHLWRQYRQLVETYRSRCGAGGRTADDGGLCELRVDPDAPEYCDRGSVRASVTARPPEVFTGAELDQHRARRSQASYAPRTAREYNTDAMDCAVDRESVLQTYRRLGAGALAAEEPALHYPRSDDLQLRTALDQQKAAFREGYREALRARPSAAPQAPRTRKPKDLALTGQALEDHRTRRRGAAYDPKTEPEFLTDAKDLSEWAFQNERLPAGHSEQVRAASGRDAILNVYRDLGRRAHQRNEPAGNYPRSQGTAHGKALGQLKKAFREGYREAQPGAKR